MRATVSIIELRCPNCDGDFLSQAVRSASQTLRHHTDFGPDSSNAQLVRHGVHLCPRCGFAGREDSFSGTRALGYEVQQRVWDELAPRLSNRPTAPSEKYEFAAKVAGWDCADALNVADLWLQAAWCCVDEGDVEAERYYRRHAAWTFEEALNRYDEVDGSERARMTYLVGELWRRIGDDAQSRAWFARVADEITDPDEQGWLVDLAQKQQDDPAEWLA
jgi:uncharacterized protein (DUF2225 family)